MIFEMIKTFPHFIRCLRKAGSYQSMKTCVFNYRALDWYHPDLYVGDIPTMRFHCGDPAIRTYSFTDFDQTIHLDPGLVAMMDGKARVHGRPIHLNDVLVLDKATHIDAVHPYSTILHVELRQ